MKKKYIMPMVGITSCYLGHALLAGSDPSKDPNYIIGGSGGSGDSGGSVKEVTDEDKPILGAKGFDAWSSWDE